MVELRGSIALEGGEHRECEHVARPATHLEIGSARIVARVADRLGLIRIAVETGDGRIRPPHEIERFLLRDAELVRPVI